MKLAILGSRGIPAKYGGFETFAEQLAQRLVRKGISVTVYCEKTKTPQPAEYLGIALKYVPAYQFGPFTTILFDLLCLWHARGRYDVVYMLGYGVAPFCLIPKMWGSRVWINVDGVEWARAKWSRIAKTYFKLMEYTSVRIADIVIADARGIQDHLRSRHPKMKPCAMIPYGAEIPVNRFSDKCLKAWDLEPNNYYLVVARLEPENHILEIVEGYRTAKTDKPLVIVGDTRINTVYIKKLLRYSNDDVRFIGGVYEKEKIQALRSRSFAYFHGHSVGGTNPSLLEALGCGNIIIAHDNAFNHEVAEDVGFYFKHADDIPGIVEIIENLDHGERAAREEAARTRIRDVYNWEKVAESYMTLLGNTVRGRTGGDEKNTMMKRGA